MLYINNKIELPLKRTLAITASQTFIFKMFFYIFLHPQASCYTIRHHLQQSNGVLLTHRQLYI